MKSVTEAVQETEEIHNFDVFDFQVQRKAPYFFTKFKTSSTIGNIFLFTLKVKKTESLSSKPTRI